jgi:hypothetical protein
MTTTGTYAFDPSAADITLNAFALCGIIRTRLTIEHFENAQFQSQMLGVDVTNRNPNRWQLENVPVTLTAGQPTYTLDRQVVAVSSVTLIQQNANPSFTPISRVLGPLSAVDYHELANPLQPGTPTSYFFSLLTPNPTLSLWLVPNQNPEFSLNVQVFKQQQDVSQRNGLTVNVPYRFLDAIVWGLAARLAVIYAPDRAISLKAQYIESITLAASLDQESVPLRLAPILSGYFPGR